MKRNILAFLAMLLAAAMASSASAQSRDLGGLRIADESGAAVGQQAAPPGEKYFHLESGTKQFYIAFDFGGKSATQVQVRVLGPKGTVLLQDTKSYDQPGVQVVKFDNKIPIEDNEYVVNAYIGPDWYLADSLQLTVGRATIVQSKGDSGTPTAVVQSQATLAPFMSQPEPPAPPTGTTAAPSRLAPVIAGIGVLILAGVVVWAVISATRSR
jgi:hypothetical protein